MLEFWRIVNSAINYWLKIQNCVMCLFYRLIQRNSLSVMPSYSLFSFRCSVSCSQVISYHPVVFSQHATYPLSLTRDLSPLWLSRSLLWSIWKYRSLSLDFGCHFYFWNKGNLGRRGMQWCGFSWRCESDTIASMLQKEISCGQNFLYFQ